MTGSASLKPVTGSLPDHGNSAASCIELEIPVVDIRSVASQADVPSVRDRTLRASAQDMEAAFIAEMLKGMDFGTPRESFGGGAGEEHFASFLRQEHADALAAKGGFGLSESIFQSLQAEQGDGDDQ